jgi:hypothetical protein
MGGLILLALLNAATTSKLVDLKPISSTLPFKMANQTMAWIILAKNYLFSIK